MIVILKLCDAFQKAGRLSAHLHVEAEALHFFNQDVERFGRTRFERIVAFHDRLVDPCSALHIVRLNGQQFL